MLKQVANSAFKFVGKMLRLLIGVVAIIALVQAKHEKYEGHQLYRVAGPPEILSFLESRLDVLSATPGVRSETGQTELLVRIPPEDKAQWFSYFDSNNMPYKLIAENLGAILREEEAEIQARKMANARNGNKVSWDNYYRHEEINNHLDELAAEYPGLVTVINAGLSYEGRQIKYVRISNNGFQSLFKPVIFIDAAVHAREWVTPPVALYIIHRLVVDIADRQLTDDIDWIIMPMANPDGYEFSHDEDRMWRKTRSKSHEGAEDCPGVDGNRNFDFHWGETGQWGNPCAITYEGPSAFSEPEIRIIRDAILQQINRVALYISLHSFGNMFLYSWGNNGTLPANGLALHLAGIQMAAAIDNLKLDKAPNYIVGNAGVTLYYTTGTSRDWTRSVGIPYTYTLELPGYEYGFVVPPTYIEQIVTETWAGIAQGAKYILSVT